MAIIGQDFPKTREARKSKLSDIIKGDEFISMVKVPGHGSRKVYRIPLEYLSYNPYNTRFLAQSKTLEKRYGRKLNDESPEDIKEIESFIWEMKKDINENTINSLIKEGQLTPGVVTNTGIILAGNRRFRLLNEIQRNYKKYSNPKVNLNGLEYFEAAILEEELTEKEIRKYESFYQYGNEDKVEYDPIQKYIAAKDQKELGYDEKAIAENFLTLTKGDDNVVKKWLEVYVLMEDYLDYIGESSIYTALQHREEAFLNLHATLKKLNSGKTGAKLWAYSDIDVLNLQHRYYDYIRTNRPTHDFRDFIKIFSDKTRWDIFNSGVKSIIKDNELESFDEYRKENTDITESQISKVRENDYVEKCGDKLDKIFGHEKGVIINKKEEETPWIMLKSISEKLDKLQKVLDEDPNHTAFEEDDFLDKIREVMGKIGKIKQRID